jgi:hypothetical protein
MVLLYIPQIGVILKCYLSTESATFCVGFAIPIAIGTGRRVGFVTSWYNSLDGVAKTPALRDELTEGN